MAKDADPETQARRERFRAYCKKRGWWNESGTWRVVDIGNAINRKTNQVNNLLSDSYSFGPTIARSIEGELDLPRFYFDGAAEWPFSRELQKAVEALEATELWRAENVLRAHLDLPPQVNPIGNRKAA